MNPYASAIGGYIGRVFDGKTIISLALIGCTTLLAWNRILDTAAWSLMVTTVGAAWGIASAASSTSLRETVTALREVAQGMKQ